MVKSKNVLGGPAKIYVRIYDKEYALPGFNHDSLYSLLLQYLEKNEYSSKNKNMDLFKEIQVEEFIFKVAESSKYIKEYNCLINFIIFLLI